MQQVAVERGARAAVEHAKRLASQPLTPRQSRLPPQPDSTAPIFRPGYSPHMQHVNPDYQPPHARLTAQANTLRACTVDVARMARGIAERAASAAPRTAPQRTTRATAFPPSATHAQPSHALHPSSPAYSPRESSPPMRTAFASPTPSPTSVYSPRELSDEDEADAEATSDNGNNVNGTDASSDAADAASATRTTPLLTIDVAAATSQNTYDDYVHVDSPRPRYDARIFLGLQ